VNARRVASEAVGTFFLVLIGPGAAMVNAYSGGALGQVGIALAFAFVVIAMISALGHLSGAHINPAVTLAFWSVRRFPSTEVVPYVVAQCAGAVAASLTLRAALGPVGNVGATLPGIPTGAAFGIEWLLSFALMFVIMAVATDERVADGFAALAVGLTVGFCALMGGPLNRREHEPGQIVRPGAGWESVAGTLAVLAVAHQRHDGGGADVRPASGDQAPRRTEQPRGGRCAGASGQ
jgi:glycerol uptake facilitator-like aquaporin